MHEAKAVIRTPDHPMPESFTDATAAVDRLEALYAQATAFLSEHFSAVVKGGKPSTRIRAFYPEIRIDVESHV